MEHHLEPARTVIRKIGGPDRVSEITSANVSRVYRWMYPREKGGTGGVIPYGHAQKLMSFASENGIELSAADFFPKGEVAA